MTELSAAALARPPEEGVRRIARELLAQARAQLERLEESRDEDALHDFRVSLRRLRSTLRVYRAYLPSERTRRALRALGRLTEGTNVARDLEVQREWLRRERRTLRGALRRAASHMVRELDGQAGARQSTGFEGVPEEFAAIERELREGLAQYRLEIRLGDAAPRPSFAAAAAALLRGQVESLRERLAEIRSAGQRDEPHRARIQAKRVRYLLEPVGQLPEARAVLHRLRQLQDLLGEFNDLWLLGESIELAFERATLQRMRDQRAAAGARDLETVQRLRRAALEPARLALLAHVAQLRAERFAELELRWLGPELPRFLLALEEGIRALEGAAGSRGLRARSFLLNGLPPRIESHAGVEIEQGWLPGERVRERLSRVRTADGGEQRLRAVELDGEGPPTLEEAMPAPVFRDLWPFTEGARLRLRRCTLLEGDQVVEIDRFLDRDLLLARVERARGDRAPEAPDWLAPHIEREVTDESEFTPAKLAR